jgi:hypothetical protein
MDLQRGESQRREKFKGLALFVAVSSAEATPQESLGIKSRLGDFSHPISRNSCINYDFSV